MRTTKTLIRLGGCWDDLSLRWAHMPFCWLRHDAAHFLGIKVLPFRHLSKIGFTRITMLWIATISSCSESPPYHHALNRHHTIMLWIATIPSCSESPPYHHALNRHHTIMLWIATIPSCSESAPYKYFLSIFNSNFVMKGQQKFWKSVEK